MQAAKRKQLDKFNRLRNRVNKEQTAKRSTASVDLSKWIVNLSDHQLTPTQRQVLERGLNFAPAPKRIPTFDIIASVEPALRTHPNTEGAERARAAVSNILRVVGKVRPPPINISKEESQALTELRMNDGIIISQADKGNVTVVMNSAAYEEKALAILDKPPFRRLKKNPASENERKINDRLKSLKQKASISQPLYNYLHATSAPPARFYGLPKVHKPDVPLRPIVSSIGTATYATSRYLSQLDVR